MKPLQIGRASTPLSQEILPRCPKLLPEPFTKPQHRSTLLQDGRSFLESTSVDHVKITSITHDNYSSLLHPRQPARPFPIRDSHLAPAPADRPVLKPLCPFNILTRAWPCAYQRLDFAGCQCCFFGPGTPCARSRELGRARAAF